MDDPEENFDEEDKNNAQILVIELATKIYSGMLAGGKLQPSKESRRLAIQEAQKIIDDVLDNT
ncbi:MAG: hypothetical protein AB8G05_06105 [Oligoflexales bacterium]